MFLRYFFGIGLCIPLAILLYIGYLRYLVSTNSSKEYHSSKDLQTGAQMIMEGFDVIKQFQPTLTSFSQEIHDTKPLKGQIAIVTGATRGLGRGIAGHLAGAGAKLILPCRRCNPQDLQKQVVNDALAYSKKYGKNKNSYEVIKPIVFDLDLADVSEIDKFIQSYLDMKLPSANILILNAGLISPDFKKTKQGFETTFGVNFYSSAYLTQKLLDNNLIRDKIVSVSSEEHRGIEPIHEIMKKQGNKKFGFSWGNGIMDTLLRYEYSKLAQTTYFLALGKRISIPIIDMCPGPVASEISMGAPWPIGQIVNDIMGLIFVPIDDAAIPVVYLATSPKVKGVTSTHYHIMENRPARDDATDPKIQQQVYDWTQQLIRDKVAPTS